MVPPGVAPVTNRKRLREAAYIPLDLTVGPQRSGPGQHREG